jgi:hypothetical protein
MYRPGRPRGSRQILPLRHSSRRSAPRCGRLRVGRSGGVKHWQMLAELSLEQHARHRDRRTPHQKPLQLSRPRVDPADGAGFGLGRDGVLAPRALA